VALQSLLAARDGGGGEQQARTTAWCRPLHLEQLFLTAFWCCQNVVVDFELAPSPPTPFLRPVRPGSYTDPRTGAHLPC